MPVIILRPNGVPSDGDDNWEVSGGLTKWAAVDPGDPITHDDGASIISDFRGGSGNIQDYLFSDLPADVGSINSVKVFIRAGNFTNASSLAQDARIFIRGILNSVVGDAAYEYPSYGDVGSNDNTYRTFPESFSAQSLYPDAPEVPRPGDGDWEPSDLEDLVIRLTGAIDFGVSGTLRVTSLWLEVDYTESNTIPDTPATPTVVADGQNALDVSWVIPDDGGSTITSQKLRYRETGAGSWETEIDLSATATTYNISGLDADTEYEVQILATNAEGDSSWSGSGTQTTEAAPDLMPTLGTVADQTGTVGTALNILLAAASGGDAPLTYSMAGLPSTLAFNSETRRITGTPDTAETLSLIYTVEDVDGDQVSRDFDLVISTAPLLQLAVAFNSGSSSFVADLSLSALVTPDPLQLSDWDGTGLDVDVLALITAGSAAEPYREGVTGTLEEGTLALDDLNKIINRIRIITNATELLLNGSGADGWTDGFVDADGEYLNASFYIQTAAGTARAQFSVTEPDELDAAGGGFIRFETSNQNDIDILDGITTGTRFIIALGRPAAITSFQLAVEFESGTSSLTANLSLSALIEPLQLAVTFESGTSSLTANLSLSALIEPLQLAVTFESGTSSLTANLSLSALVEPLQLAVEFDSGTSSLTANLTLSVITDVQNVVHRIESTNDLALYFDAPAGYGGNSGEWENDSGGTSSSADTGPGTNSGGPYVVSDSSGGSLSAIPENSVLAVLPAVMSSWTGDGRVLGLRLAIAGAAWTDSGEGFEIQGRASASDSWSRRAILYGWDYQGSPNNGDTVIDNNGATQTFVQDGGWVDFEVDIDDDDTEVRLRSVPVAGAGNNFQHDVAMWQVEFRDGTVTPPEASDPLQLAVAFESGTSSFVANLSLSALIDPLQLAVAFESGTSSFVANLSLSALIDPLQLAVAFESGTSSFVANLSLSALIDPLQLAVAFESGTSSFITDLSLSAQAHTVDAGNASFTFIATAVFGIYTEPKTFIPGEMPNADDLNTYLRDNLLYLYERIGLLDGGS